MATATDITLIRAANQGLVNLALRDLNMFWASLNLERPEAARDALLRFLPVLTARYGEGAASIAADWYDDLRLDAGVRPGFRAQMAAPVAAGVVQQRVRFGAQHLFTDAPTQTLVFLRGAVTRYVLQPGRETIVRSSIADPAAVGWHRETRPSRAYASGCDFCQMLAGRGGVYKRATATFAAHDDCKCVAVPSWDADAPEVPAEAYRASERMDHIRRRAAAGDQEAIWRVDSHNYAIRRAIRDYVD